MRRPNLHLDPIPNLESLTRNPDAQESHANELRAVGRERRSEVARFEADKESLGTDLARCEADKESLGTDLARCEADRESLGKDLARCEADRESLGKDLARCEADISNLRDEKEELLVMLDENSAEMRLMVSQFEGLREVT